MPNIYQSALLNIAAEWAMSSQHGLFSKRDVSALEQQIVTFNDGRSYNVQGRDSVGLSSNLRGTPLQRRGWVMQERILSPRIVHFTEKQLSRECSRSTDVCERWPGGNPDTTFLADRVAFGRTPGEVYEGLKPVRSDDPVWLAAGEYFTLLEEYNNRELTFPGADKLPAFGAIAEQFSRRFQSRYTAGLFECHLPSALAWYTYKTPPSRMDTTTYRCPSWSWASIYGPISVVCNYHDHITTASSDEEPKSTHLPFARLLDMNITLKDSQNPFGQLTYADIAIQAPLVSCHWNPWTNNTGFDQFQGDMYLHMPPAHLKVTLMGFLFDVMDDLMGEQEDVVVAILDVVIVPQPWKHYKNMKISALILKKVNKEGKLSYRRMGGGSFSTFVEPLPHFQTIPFEDIVIV
jgi:hypothetical protein